MSDCQLIKNKLKRLYGQEILCRVGDAKPEYNMDKELDEKANLAVYINANYKIALVWDLKRRRLNKRVVKTVSISKKWDEIDLKNGYVSHYKKMGVGRDAPYEKVLILDIDTLDSISEDLYLYIKFNQYDEDFPNDLYLKKDNGYDDLSDAVRKRVSSDRWSRKASFREEVLAAYNRQCAICRCSEVKILEAAHIKAVADKGLDDPRNGICLCANHHIMFDKELIKINFKSYILDYISPSVRDMPWYNDFVHKYGGKLIIPNKVI